MLNESRILHALQVILGGCTMLFLTGAINAQSVIYVDDDVVGGDGASWATAFADLQDALAAASSGNEIWVAQGTYRPAPSGGSRLISFSMKNGVALYGGFDGTETDISLRNPALNVTTLTADLNLNDNPLVPGSDGDNSYHVVWSVGLSASSILDGFTISDGRARDDGLPTPFFRGGGMYINGGAPTIANCIFEDNVADVTGGAIHGESSSASFTNVVFRDNTAISGGGYYANHGSPFFNQCSFINNQTLLAGGGGFYLAFDGSPVLLDCMFIGNVGKAPVRGGGAALKGTGVAINCLFVGNNPDGIRLADTAQAINCTIADNIGNGVVGSHSNNAQVINCVIWGNSADQIFSDPAFPYNPPDVMFSDVQGGFPAFPGTYNINADPLFVQPSSGDYRLSPGSPCVDLGDTAALPPGITTDLAGNPRVQNGIVDLGAYEGEHVPGPMVATAEDLDPYEVVQLKPSGDPGDGTENPSVWIANITGSDNATASVLQTSDEPESTAPGYRERSELLRVETTLLDGEMLVIPQITFDLSVLNGLDPFELDLIVYDELAARWVLASELNVVNSPGHNGSVGDRILTEGPDYSSGGDMGDYGVHWNPRTQKGVVWARVDHSGLFGLALTQCVADITPEGNVDGVVNVNDLLEVIVQWGSTQGTADIKPFLGDGIVNVNDLLKVLSGWGNCPG